MRARDAAALATRPAKDRSYTPEMLRERWQVESDTIGMTVGHALEAEVCGRTAPELQPALEWDDLVEALINPETGVCARRARFKEAHVVEQVAAFGSGRLDVSAVERLASEFLDSDEAVLLVDRTGRRSPEYSTVDHLLTEDAVLYHLDRLTARRVVGIDRTIVERAIAAEAPGLGADQADAVRALCSAGEALRSLIAPAGFGKTTAVHAGVMAARDAGLPVVGLATTNQAAGELRHAGIPATTIARFTFDGTRLAPGTLVVLDEVSQVASRDAEVVLAAVAATPGARLWCLGDPHQAQPVRAGGLGAEIGRLGDQGRIPAPALTVNRRQEDPAERTALARYRSGLVVTSQVIRRQRGWEHDLGSPLTTREALADAVAVDIASHGPANVVALAISHADCEDLADRIRSRLQAQGLIRGPELIGPGWGAGERHYATGDRILIHGTVRTGGRRLHNGTVLSVTAIDDAGLHGVDDRGSVAMVPRSFVEGRRSDGSPNCSHAWARTVDGIQGGTWTQAHLLGTAALERFTGYVGQSRSRQPTHTWNVTPVPEVDFGGVLADQRSAERVVLDALRRLPDTGFATHDRPRTKEELLAERAEHHAVLAARPRDRSADLRRAEQSVRSAEQELYWANHRLDAARERLERCGPLTQLRRHGRLEKARTIEDIDRFSDDVTRAAGRLSERRADVDGLAAETAESSDWHRQNGWRCDRLRAVEQELAAVHGYLPLRDVDLGIDWSDRGIRRNGWERTVGLDAFVSPTGPTADIARPPLPGHDGGIAMDLGF
jgi:hypothetical protein